MREEQLTGVPKEEDRNKTASHAKLKCASAYFAVRDTGPSGAILIFLPLSRRLDTGKFAPFLVRNSG
jgi:hypothetical protein